LVGIGQGNGHWDQPPICPVEQIYQLRADEFPLGMFSEFGL
jgi:hypothetical protein